MSQFATQLSVTAKFRLLFFINPLLQNGLEKIALKKWNQRDNPSIFDKVQHSLFLKLAGNWHARNWAKILRRSPRHLVERGYNHRVFWRNAL